MNQIRAANNSVIISVEQPKWQCTVVGCTAQIKTLQHCEDKIIFGKDLTEEWAGSGKLCWK